VDDASAYGDALAASPAGKLWDDPACAELRQMVAEQIDALGKQAEQALGVDVLRFPELVEGPVAIALLDLQAEPGSHDDFALSVCLLADVGPNVAECRELLDRLSEHLLDLDEGILRSTETVEGAEVATYTDSRVDEQSGSRVRYTLKGPVAVVLVEVGGLRRDDLPGILAGLGAAPAASLANEPAFAESLAGAPGENLRLWADLGRIIERALPSPAGDAGAVAAGIDAEEERQITALGLRDLGVLSMRSQCGPQGSYGALRLEWPGNGWIPRMMRNFFQPGDFPRLRYVPAAAHGVNAFRVDLAGLFDQVIKLLIESGEHSPAEVVRGLQEAEEFLGFNPRDDLLEAFDGEFVLVSGQVDESEALPALHEALNVAMIAGLRDAAEFDAFLADLIHRRGLRVAHRTEVFEGATIHYQSLFPLPVPICYAIVDDTLVLSGAPGLVRQIVHQRRAPEAPGLAELPAYREAVAALRPGYGLLGYSDAASDMKSLLRFLKQAPEMFSGEEDETGMLAWLAHVPLPDEAVVDKYFQGGTATALTVDQAGLSLESVGP
ncbi:MAG TPA: hypothetical protein VFD43_08975, partial [Planctomycetota bacterium]|nr:hypothetical protein [Planctomycetota bacterium]